ncbi:hypothetical protein, partial [Anaerotignum sp.]|uniref:hypothetical protein n=1 Tax=Anaerotignum sp. TaxID=2039241 RepID=UPI003993CFB2
TLIGSGQTTRSTGGFDFYVFFRQYYNFIEIGKIAFFQKENSVYSQYGSEGGGYCVCVKR